MMDHFSSAGIRISYLDRGEGDPLLLIHGFASSSRINWVVTGWVDFFVRAGRRVIAVDNRGHGESEKLYDPAEYKAPVMAEDSRRLLDHLGIERVDVVGYSMGARIALFLSLNHCDRVRRLVLGGVGSHLLVEAEDTNEIVAALDVSDPSEAKTQVARAFRRFADANGCDLKALSACMRSIRTPIRPGDLARLRRPVLVVAGAEDEIAGDIALLGACFPAATLLAIPGRDHVRVVGDSSFKEGVSDFLRAPENPESTVPS